MIKKDDSKQLNRYFPNEDWEKLFWGFTCYSRQSYAGTVTLDAEDEIMLGIRHPEGGCLCELSISWHRLNQELVPRLTAFSEAWRLFLTPTFQLVLDQFTRQKNPLATPDEVSALLIACGFIDQSDNPLPGTEAARE